MVDEEGRENEGGVGGASLSPERLGFFWRLRLMKEERRWKSREGGREGGRGREGRREGEKGDGKTKSEG